MTRKMVGFNKKEGRLVSREGSCVPSMLKPQGSIFSNVKKKIKKVSQGDLLLEERSSTDPTTPALQTSQKKP